MQPVPRNAEAAFYWLVNNAVILCKLTHSLEYFLDDQFYSLILLRQADRIRIRVDNDTSENYARLRLETLENGKYVPKTGPCYSDIDAEQLAYIINHL